MTDSRKDVAFHSSDRMIYAQERKKTYQKGVKDA
jgi:hypothetical protein